MAVGSDHYRAQQYDLSVRRSSLSGPPGHYEHQARQYRPQLQRQSSVDRRPKPYEQEGMSHPQSELQVRREMSLTDTLENHLALATKSGRMLGSVPVSHRKLFARAFDGLF
jgi:hypothetical protein